MTAEGLEPMLDVPLYGRIGTMQFFRPKVRFDLVPVRLILFCCREMFKIACSSALNGACFSRTVLHPVCSVAQIQVLRAGL